MSVSLLVCLLLPQKGIYSKTQARDTQEGSAIRNYSYSRELKLTSSCLVSHPFAHTLVPLFCHFSGSFGQCSGHWLPGPDPSSRGIPCWPKLQGALLRATPRGRVQHGDGDKTSVKFMDSFFPMSDPSVMEEIRTKLCLYFLSCYKSL